MFGTTVTVLCVLFAWWASTGLVLGLVWLSGTARRLAFAAATLAGGVALFGAVVTSSWASRAGVWGGFFSALVIWGWHEQAFLLGIVTGPNQTACPPHARGWDRFRLATLTVIHHELALFLTLLGLAGLTWNAPNQVAISTFTVLWAMRLSSKFNLFFGVRNVADEFLPAHLQFLRSFFRKSARSPLLLASIGVGSCAVAVLVAAAARVPLHLESELLQLIVVTTLLALGVLEHLFLALPLRDAVLWRWIIRGRGQAPTPQTASS